MKYLALSLLFTTAASGNTFVLKERPFAFHLSIKKDSITYNSEARNFERALNECSLKIAANLNAEIFQRAETEKGAKRIISVDGKSLSVSEKAWKYFRSMDVRILQYLQEEKTKCSP